MLLRSPVEIQAQESFENHIAHLLILGTVFHPRQGRGEGSTVKPLTWLGAGAEDPTSDRAVPHALLRSQTEGRPSSNN
jgi:hypothetical protein